MRCYIRPPDPETISEYVFWAWASAHETTEQAREQQVAENVVQRGFPRGHSATKRFARRLLTKMDRQTVRLAYREMVRQRRQCKIKPASQTETIAPQISVIDTPIQPNAPGTTRSE